MIDTPQLRLRRCRPADADAVFAYRSRADVAAHLSAGAWTREHTVRELAAYESAPFDGPGDELVLLAETRDDASVVGEVGLVWLAEPDGVAEIGYVFNPEFGGRGFATEAVSAVIRWALDERDFSRVTAVTDAANTASRALCDRVGMSLVTTSRSTDGRGVVECTYAIGGLAPA
ncbi:GNAT family N-acetyltransferase [Labedella endophytica]|uniref:N-acetyltransferase n=1 Tax=Labedella endophytica TaxID=1523160 RepID=A0A3S0VB38_9MICO|nr:GNAT family N-acetyltransferase [Labedella endophytica]RUR01209.1 N-acetyltransferase [Labedella endophytica]